VREDGPEEDIAFATLAGTSKRIRRARLILFRSEKEEEAQRRDSDRERDRERERQRERQTDRQTQREVENKNKNKHCRIAFPVCDGGDKRINPYNNNNDNPNIMCNVILPYILLRFGICEMRLYTIICTSALLLLPPFAYN